MVKVSIVVPIYNVEKFLRGSIESIQKQTLEDIQIILVNDGSTDKSLSICKEIQEKDKRIEVIDKPNGGVSSARNAGIKIAKGEYIGFVDPDDWIDPDMYENMYKQTTMDNSDLCMCNYVIENNNHSIPNLLFFSKDVLKGQEIFDDIITNMIASSSLNSSADTIMGSVWRLIIKKEIFEKYNLKFQSDITLMEDLIFCIQVLLKCSKVSISRGTYYHYIIHSNSAVASYKENIFDMQLKVYRVLEYLLKEEDLYLKVKKRMDIRYTNIYINSIVNEAHHDNRKTFLERIKFIKQICKDDKLERILKELDTTDYTFRKRIVLKAIHYELGIFLYLYYYLLLWFFNKINKYIG